VISRRSSSLPERLFFDVQRSANTCRLRIDLGQLEKYLGPEVLLARSLRDPGKMGAAHAEEEYSTASIRRKFATARVFSAIGSQGRRRKLALWRIRLDLGVSAFSAQSFWR